MQKFARCAIVALMWQAPSAFADPLPAARKTDWTYAGVPGGIPNRSTICATFSPGASAAAINSAISSCSNGVVMLNAGTYSAASLGGTINLYKSNVTLRGAGADKTILTGGNILNLGNGSNQSLGTSISGATMGSRQFTAANTNNLAVGTVIEVARDDDPNLVAGPTQNGKRNVHQVNVVTGISGSTVTVRNPWVYNFSTGNPNITYYYSGVTRLSGIENVKLNHAGFSGGMNLMSQYCDSCWIKGVESAAATSYHFVFLGSVNMELRDSYVHDGGSGPDNSGYNFYGNYQYGANSSGKIENNIFNKDFPALQMNGSSNGFAISYNYTYGSPSQSGSNVVTWTLDDGHAPFNIMNLYEGNIAEQWGADNYYGGSGLGVALRNYFTGYNPNYGVTGDAVWLDRLAYNYSVIGNVLGSSNQKTAAYQDCDNNAIYRLGFPNLGNCDTTAWDGYATPGGYPDSKVASTLLRWGNYDYSTKSVRFVATEIPSSVAKPSDQIIPKSYAYAAKPAWWPTAVAWPPIGPDVTGGNGDASGHVNKIPAQICWENYNLRAGGAFNANTCYPAGTAASGGGSGGSSGSGSTTAATAPVINSSLSALATPGKPFAYTITATNKPTSFSATGLPSGLTTNQTTGQISGTPTTSNVASTSGVKLIAKNAAGAGSATMILTIQNPAPPSVGMIGSQAIAPVVDNVSAGQAEAFQTTAKSSGAVSFLSVYLDASSSAQSLVAGIYKDAGGHPGALVAQGAVTQVRAAAWNKVPLRSTTVTAGAKYWIAILNPKLGTLRFRDGRGCSSETSAQSTLTSLPTNWSTGAIWDSCGLSAFGSAP